jgi:hypothetical protein
MTPRLIEKLKALGFTVNYNNIGLGRTFFITEPYVAGARGNYYDTEAGAWLEISKWVASPEGMKATMADKVRWLLGNGRRCDIGERTDPDGSQRFFANRERGDSPEAAVHELWLKVP